MPGCSGIGLVLTTLGVLDCTSGFKCILVGEKHAISSTLSLLFTWSEVVSFVSLMVSMEG
eukprot:3395461-Pleurochrysis_carterae.AAC.1